jgi:hypothetical protein
MLDEVPSFARRWIILRHLVFVELVDFEYAIAALEPRPPPRFMSEPSPHSSRDSILLLDCPTPHMSCRDKISGALLFLEHSRNVHALQTPYGEFKVFAPHG